MGTPIIGYDIGGPAESLRACFPQGLVENGNDKQLLERTQDLLAHPQPSHLDPEFTLDTLAQKTMALYRRLLAQRPSDNQS